MQIGMVDPHQEWIFCYIKTHEQLKQYNGISVPAYHDLTPKNKSFEDISQCNGTDIKVMSTYIV
jgi:hypothetical protein